MIVSIPRTEKLEYQWGMRRIRHIHVAHLGLVRGPETQRACRHFGVSLAEPFLGAYARLSWQEPGTSPANRFLRGEYHVWPFKMGYD